MADTVLLGNIEHGGRLAEHGVEEHGIVAESPTAHGRARDLARPLARCDQGGRILGASYRDEHAMKAALPLPVWNIGQALKEERVVPLIGRSRSREASGANARLPSERVNGKARVVGDGR